MGTEKSHEYFMQLALKEALRAKEQNEVPIGALLVINDQIICKAYNQVELMNDSTAHAEIIALTSAYHSLGSKYLPDASLYVTLEPCIMCAGAIFWGKIGTLVYGAADAKKGYSNFVLKNKSDEMNMEFPILHPKTKVINGICQGECSKIIQDFFKSKR